MPGFATGAAPDPDPRGSGGSAESRVDRVVSVPLSLLFRPDPDPTELFPGQAADLEGYVMTPDHEVTLAVTASTPEGVEMLDAVWAALRRKGTGRRHMVLLDDRGRTVSVMTLRVDAPDEILRRLRSLLVVPIHARAGWAEVHLLATDEEMEALEGTAQDGWESFSAPSTVTLPPARETRTLQPGDWAFLGLLSSVGALDGPEGPTPELVAELFGVDPDAFAEQARAVERSLQDVVTGLFATPETGTELESGPP